ncbi:hypothetical protein FYK55_03670 [Roseiconus nitratireducens]|uniref:Uncharacterized protein n=1 Tax=Roseiconus nitratireducens TaxID=2605748 RepID=A0A5M6DI27_9BACT|nr:hypothetical protein [Roseiconus nitratireducens]KAA5546016.1 hypothetical protein FYK55_03670 [Roseiconus nitratireducens]
MREYEDAIEAAERRAVVKLVAIGQKAISAGDIEKASNSFKEALYLEPTNDAATTFFKTIGREDVIKETRREGDDEVTRTEFRSDDGLVLRRLPGGEWSGNDSKHKNGVEEEKNSVATQLRFPREDIRLLIFDDRFFWNANGQKDHNDRLVWHPAGSGAWTK